MAVDIGVVSADEIDALVEAAGRRDSQAFERLYETFAPRVHQYLVRHLNGRSAEAEDLTAEVFAKIYEKIGGYENRGVPFSAWLFRIAHNQLIDHVRRSPRHEAVSLETAFDLPEVGAGR